MASQNFSSSFLLPSLSPSTLPSSLLPAPSASTTAFGSSTSCKPASPRILSDVLAPVLSLEFILGLLGNSLAFLIFCVHARPWTSNTVFLVSLVIADFLLIINLPLRVFFYAHQENWQFGDLACKVNLFMLSTNRTASVVFLTAIAFNRYLKVVWPHHVLSRASVWAAARVAGGLWGCILLLNVHVLCMTYSSPFCQSFRLDTGPWPLLQWHHTLYVLEFFLPLPIILFSIVSIGLTIRRRRLGEQVGPRRTMRLLTAVVAVYTICFLPSVLFDVASMVALYLENCRAVEICSQLFHGSLAFTYLNSVLDPMLYCFSSPNILRQGKAFLGFARGWQGPANNESISLPPARLQEASRKVEAAGKLQAEVSPEVSLDYRKTLPRTGVCQEEQVTP